jgi:hypothetical protein
MLRSLTLSQRRVRLALALVCFPYGLWLGWRRLQARLLSLYLVRVRRSARLWVALGRPAQWKPVIPWWHQLLFSWLVFSGQLSAPPPRLSRRERYQKLHRQQQVQRGAVVREYVLWTKQEAAARSAALPWQPRPRFFTRGPV